MRRARVVIAAAAIGIVGAGAALFYAWQPALAPITPPAPATFDQALVRRGAELALLGDCQTCHTAPGGRTFAGSLAMPTPFGTIYSTNITPDPETGIGQWSEAAFARALREGVDREGRHLYPAFPYDHFTLISDDDVRALYAFFMSREPVTSTPPPNALPFPINVRLVLAGWKLLFLDRGRFEPAPSRDQLWNRGKYLVEGLGHCGGCHTPRNVMGAEKTSRAFAGGEAEGWRAYALGAASQAPTPWNEAALAQYLSRGFHPLHGVARGPMAPVVANLAQVSQQDIIAMARYMASLSKPEAAEANAQPAQPLPEQGPGIVPQSAGSQAPTPVAGTADGAGIYATACASCHASDRPLPLGAIRLSLSTAITDDSPDNLINIILSGIPASNGTAGPIMPSFSSAMSAGQISDLARYLRSSFTTAAPWADVDDTVRTAIAEQRKARAQRLNSDR